MEQISETVGARVRQERERLRLSQAKLAQSAGISQQTIWKIENDVIEKSRYLPRIAIALGLRVEDLDPDFFSEDNPPLPPPSFPPIRTPSNIFAPGHALADSVAVRPLRMLPMGQFLLSEPPFGFVGRPGPVQDAPNAYALHVADVTMIPAIDPGDTILVNPDRPPLPGTDCVFLAWTEPRSPKRVEIGRLLEETEALWRIQQHNPKKVVEIRRGEASAAHRIIAIYRKP